MAGLTDGLRSLLTSALPTLFGGDQPTVQLDITGETFQIDPTYAEVSVSAPQPDDKTDKLAFDAVKATGPYVLTQPPLAGPRRVALLTKTSEKISLNPDEVVWDKTEVNKFSLQLRPTRDLNEIVSVQVAYSVAAVTTRLRGTQKVSVHLQPKEAVPLTEVCALTLSVIALNRQALIDGSSGNYTSDNYGTQIKTSILKIIQAEYTSTAVTIHLEAELQMCANRTLSADEGNPIVRVVSLGRTSSPGHPVNIDVNIDV